MITCKFDDGGAAELRHVVTDGIVIQDNKILLVKRAPHLSEGGKFGLPGGYLNRDETVQQGCTREVLEETGWECKMVQLLTVVDNTQRGDDRQNVGFIFLMKPIIQSAKPDSESTEVTWFPLDALPKSEEIAFDHERIIRTYVETTHQGKPYPQFLS